MHDPEILCLVSSLMELLWDCPSLSSSREGPIWQHVFQGDAGLHSGVEGRVREGLGACHSNFSSPCVFRAYQTAN